MRGGRASTPRSLRRARRSIRNRRTTALGRAYKRRYHMRSNPGVGDVVTLFKQILPVCVGLYGSRILSSASIAAQVPLINSLPAQYQRLAMGAVALGGAHMLTKHVKALAMKQHIDLPVTAQEREAYTSVQYVAAIDAEATAAGEYERMKALREAAAMTIEAWRTASSNYRSMKL